MVLENPVVPFWQWLPGSLLTFVAVGLVVALLGVFIGFLFAAARHGPLDAIRFTLRTVAVGFRELLELSPRRILAMSRLAFQEALRRKVLIVFAVFLVCMLFAGWFLDRGADHPGRLYLSFVLTGTNFLIVLLAIFLGSFSLPNDLKYKTIYTVVTKPVRAWEIVLGRILGFSAIGTLLLALMGVFSYAFVVRGLNHTHEVNPDELAQTRVESGGRMVAVRQGQTSRELQHRHDVVIDEEGRIRMDAIHDHVHTAAVDDAGKVQVEGPRGHLQARIPIYGRLRFKGRDGEDTDKGVNVGNEWTYRSYIEGGTLATAIWTFDDPLIDEFQFPEGLPMEMTLRVFRTYKGDIESGIFGSIQVVEADSAPPGTPPTPLEARKRFEKIGFTAREFTTDSQLIPRKYRGIEPDGTTREMDLFADLVHDGKVEIWIQCGERAQYYGVAQPDLYVRAADGYFWVNFLKGFVGLWYQMLVVTCFAVMFSTFLTGPVAMLATVASLVLAYFAYFVKGVATGEIEGGGPTESVVRLFSQMNQTLPLQEGVTTSVLQGTDFVLMLVMRALASVMPNYAELNTADFVAYGFDINNNLLAQHALIGLGYVLALTCAGYFCLRTREIAA
jgi:ABC-type transport system involved in multi-copper enzyme maturation permease subunit